MEKFCIETDFAPAPLTNGEPCLDNFECDITDEYYEAICLEGECRPLSPEGGPCVEKYDCFDIRYEIIDELVEVFCENRIC